MKHEGKIIGVLQVLNPRAKESFESEDLDGFEAYATLTATAIEKLRALERMRQQERMERDVAIAAEIQSELLSRALPGVIPGAAFAAHNEAASNVGGDFYSVFVKSPDEIYFVIGDVSGKGITASLLMAQTLSAMRFVFDTATSPADALGRLNSTLSDNIVRGMFVTTLAGRMTPSTGEVELASAGHCQPLLVHSDGRTEYVQTAGALPIGIMPHVTYKQGRIRLSKGDWMVFYTDGLSESKKNGSADFFEEHIAPTLGGMSHASPQDIIDRLTDAERRHRGAGAQFDDLTILVGGLL